MSDVEPLFRSPRLPYRRQRTSPSSVTQMEIAASSFSAISARSSLRTWPTASFSCASVTGAWPGAGGAAGAAVVAGATGTAGGAAFCAASSAATSRFSASTSSWVRMPLRIRSLRRASSEPA